MRKILAGILIGVLCVGSLSGCGKGTSESGWPCVVSNPDVWSI